VKKDECETHPSYGQAVFHRTYGNIGRLYGSPLERHHTAIRLTISRSEVRHDLAQDWRYAREQLIEVTFSAAQFADLLTTMNVGEGVPCTIEHVAGVDQGQVPEEMKVEHEKVVVDYFENGSRETVAKLRQGLVDLKALLNKKSLTKADKERIEWLVGRALQDVESNQPFAVAQFGEAAQKIVGAAKAEVAATTQALVERLGFKKMDEMRQILGAEEAPAAPALAEVKG
jgi:hypothetical protein